MKVHTLKVTYTREKQPKDYEKAAPAIELSAAIDDGEDHLSAAHLLMQDATQVVYAALGMDIPEQVLAKLQAGQTPEGVEVEASIPAGAVATAGGTVVQLPPGKRKPGRPPKNKTPETAAAAPTQTNAVASDAPPISDFPRKDVPDVPDETQVTTKTTASQAAPAAATADVPSEAAVQAATPATPAVTTAGMTAADLQSYITKMVQTKKITVQSVKDILAKNNAARTSEIPVEKLADVKKQIDDAIELSSMA